jgi:hypothetical protein
MGPDWVVRDAGGKFVYPWYSFPLKDGKAWTVREENLDFNLNKVSRDPQLKATAIKGSPGAFMIEARTAEGLRARYDYRPDLGWFSEYRTFNPSGNPAVYQLRIVNEGQGLGWSGTYYTAKADLLLSTVTAVSPPAAQVTPSTQNTFTVTTAQTQVLAIPFAFAAAGAAETELVAPDNRHWESYTVADQNGQALRAAQPGLLFVPAAAGDWRCVTAGAGAIAFGGGCLAWGVALAAGTL